MTQCRRALADLLGADPAGIVVGRSMTDLTYDVARTLARETGATMAVLDPIEGVTDESAGRDYFAVMRANLATLRTGQGCS